MQISKIKTHEYNTPVYVIHVCMEPQSKIVNRKPKPKTNWLTAKIYTDKNYHFYSRFWNSQRRSGWACQIYLQGIYGAKTWQDIKIVERLLILLQPLTHTSCYFTSSNATRYYRCQLLPLLVRIFVQYYIIINGRRPSQ